MHIVVPRTKRSEKLFKENSIKGFKRTYWLLFWLLLFVVASDFAHARLKVDFHFKDIKGNVYTPASLKGKPIVVYVGSTL